MERNVMVIERPRWAKRDRALELTGIGELTLLKLVNDGLVRARKMGPEKKSGCVFSVPDIEEWLENDAIKAGPFAIPGDGRKTEEGEVH